MSTAVIGEIPLFLASIACTTVILRAGLVGRAPAWLSGQTVTREIIEGEV